MYTVAMATQNINSVSDEHTEKQAKDSNSKKEIPEDSRLTVGMVSGEAKVPRCGWGSFTPDCLQVLHNPVCLLVTLCIMIIIQGAVLNGFVGTSVTTLQKRFNLSSTQIGVMNAAYDIAIVLLLIPVTFYGGSGHKGRMLGIGTVVMGIGSIIYAIPQFVSGRYKYKPAHPVICQPGLNVTNPCSEDHEASSNMFYVFLLGSALEGFGVSTMFTLPFTYLDENVSNKNSGLFTGIYYGISIAGSAIGFLVAGVTLTIYGDILWVEDVKSIDLTQEDPRWYGAWWIGFVGAGIAAILVSIPLFGFARELPNAESAKASRALEAASTRTTGGFGRNIKDLPRTMKLLCSNATFMLLIFADGVDSFLLGGFVMFIPKFLEVQFGVSSSQAAFYAGVAVVPAGLTGSVISGLIIRKFNFNIVQIIRFGTAMFAISFFFMFSLFISCEQPPLLGLSLEEYDLEEITAHNVSACNSGCGCDVSMYDPVCHAQSKTLYFSPCHAGCQLESDGKYMDCQCLGGNYTAVSQNNDTILLPSGDCQTKCVLLIPFIILIFLVAFFTFMAATPNIQAVLRCVEFSQRSLATGIGWMVVRITGQIPGPILFGLLLDRTCDVWSPDCGQGTYCLIYDKVTMTHNVAALALTFRIVSILFMFLASLVYKQVKPDDVLVEESRL